ncbi:MAG: SCP2 sterol-binding domain-containing protein [Thermoplasmatota archaeon]
MPSTVEECIHILEGAFWRRYNANPEIQAKLKGKNRIVQLEFLDVPGYAFHFEDGKLARIEPGHASHPDVVLSTTKHDFLAIFNKEISPAQAYFQRKVKVKATLRDLLFAKSLLGW